MAAPFHFIRSFRKGSGRFYGDRPLLCNIRSFFSPLLLLPAGRARRCCLPRFIPLAFCSVAHNLARFSCRKSWASLPTGWGWPFNFSPCLTSRKSHSLCATATGICARFFWGQNLVIQKTTSGHLKKIRQFAPAPTPFVSSVGNPPTDQDSNCVPFRFLAFLLLETVYLFRSVRTLVPIFRCLIFSLSCSKLFKAVVESGGFGEFGFGFIRRIAAFSVSVSNSR